MALAAGASVDKKDMRVKNQRAIAVLAIFLSLFLVFYTLLAGSAWARKIYLVFAVLVLGLGLNMTFSYIHAALALGFNIKDIIFTNAGIVVAFVLISGVMLGAVCGWFCPLAPYRR